VRAGQKGPVELVAVPRADFLRVIEDSPITAEALGIVVQQRLEEHRSKDLRGKRRPAAKNARRSRKQS
jgi:hypothetical protein